MIISITNCSLEPHENPQNLIILPTDRIFILKTILGRKQKEINGGLTVIE